ncbi:MAG: sulfotransferase family 2 domain-containing protein [Pseudomonadota bacterium]
MPILAKDAHRVLFAHIPKTGGTSVYHEFVASGWQISNLADRTDAQSTAGRLRARHGPIEIHQTGLRFAYPHPVQHAPAALWRFWGPFTSSFAIVRHPEDRFASALQFFHARNAIEEPLDSWASDLVPRLETRPWARYRRLHGHLMPQHHFVAPTTQIFKFESAFMDAIRSTFGLAPGLHMTENRHEGARLEITPAIREWVNRAYRNDFERFGYTPR